MTVKKKREQPSMYIVCEKQRTLLKGVSNSVQWNLDLRKPDLRKNFDLRKIVGTTDFLVDKLFDLRKIF